MQWWLHCYDRGILLVLPRRLCCVLLRRTGVHRLPVVEVTVLRGGLQVTWRKVAAADRSEVEDLEGPLVWWAVGRRRTARGGFAVGVDFELVCPTTAGITRPASLPSPATAPRSLCWTVIRPQPLTHVAHPHACMRSTAHRSRGLRTIPNDRHPRPVQYVPRGLYDILDLLFHPVVTGAVREKSGGLLESNDSLAQVGSLVVIYCWSVRDRARRLHRATPLHLDDLPGQLVQGLVDAPQVIEVAG